MPGNYLSEVTDFDREAAREYKVHIAFILAIRRGEWGAVKHYAQQQWNRDGWVCLRRNQNAVNRILKEFGERKGIPKYTADKDTQKRIAIYVQRLGVARLIDDIRDALKTNPRIRTIQYFMQPAAGAGASRWGNLYRKRQEEIYAQEKEDYRRDGVFFRENVINEPVNQKVTPQWVIDARKRLEVLRKKGLDLDKVEMQERATLELRLSNFYRKNAVNDGKCKKKVGGRTGGSSNE